MEAAVLPSQPLPIAPRGNTAPASSALIWPADGAPNAVSSSAQAASAGSASPSPANGATHPVSGFAAAVLAALAAAKPGRANATPPNTPPTSTIPASAPPANATATDTPGNVAANPASPLLARVDARGPAKSKSTTTDKPATQTAAAAAAITQSPIALTAFLSPQGATPTNSHAPATPAASQPGSTVEVGGVGMRPSRPSPDNGDDASVSVKGAKPGKALATTEPAKAPTPETGSPAPTTPTASLAAMPPPPQPPSAAPDQAPPTDTASTAHASATAVQVSGALGQLSQSGGTTNGTTITLHLAPPALGNVAIRISAPHGAPPVVTITASHQASADALATAKPNLEAALVRAGLPAETRVIVHQPNTQQPGGENLDRGSRQPGGQPRRQPPRAPSNGEPSFAEALDISA